jgi:hypothetical protein
MARFNKMKVKKLYLGSDQVKSGQQNTRSTLVTATAAELNLMDGVTATTTELNLIDGVTATTAEINAACDKSTAAVVSITTGTLAITQTAHAGKICVFNKNNGIDVTLPEATGTGDVYTFVVGTALTSDTITITTADTTNADITGWAEMYDADVVEVWEVYPAKQSDGFDTITMNRTTQGGISIGLDRVVLTDIKTDIWLADIRLYVPAGSNPATPFSSVAP